MKLCLTACLALGLVLSAGGACRAMGIEAAEKAEAIIAYCREKPVLRRPLCLSTNLSRKWRFELGYAGQPFSAVGQLEEVRRSLAGNVFAFVAVGDYRVGCRVTEGNAEPLKTLSGRRVQIRGVLEGYHMTFDLHRLHHLRLTPYCVIEAAV